VLGSRHQGNHRRTACCRRDERAGHRWRSGGNNATKLSKHLMTQSDAWRMIGWRAAYWHFVPTWEITALSCCFRS